MSVTNAISGMVGVGGMFIMGGGYMPQTVPQWLAALSVVLANVNIFGGFVITKRMLDMFRVSTNPLFIGTFLRFLSELPMLLNICTCTASPRLSLAVGLCGLRALELRGKSP